MDLLKMVTAGSVDDGKSTLIGRLLFDSKVLLGDQMHSLERLSRKKGLEHLDFSLVTDGLKDELALGITIDVAYKYFTTAKRKFILADTPGHFEYTRNYVTAVSNANLALILIDAGKGIVEQTRRHAFLASLTGVKHLIFCINKMDFVDYSEEVFMNIRSGIEQFSSKLEVYDIRYIPLAALHGENIVHLSEHMPWYKGSSLLDTLENIHIASDKNYIDARFPIQHSISFDDGHSSYAGQVAGGTFRKGDEVVVLPSGSVSRISTIYGPKGYINEATPAMSVSIALADEVNANRGSMLVKKNNQPLILTELDLMVCWFSGQELGPGAEIIVRNSLSEVRGTVKDILYVIDINSFSRNEGKRELCENEIGRLKISLKHPMICDEYRHIKATGSVILIDKDTNNTVGAGLVRITHEVNN